MHALRLALRMLSRDWRSGELTVLIAAMLLAVASVGTVGFFSDRVKGALGRQANLLLGADVVVSGDRPLPETYAQEAKRRGLASTPVLKFNSMVQRANAEPDAPAVLADVKAVAAGYPLRGAIVVVDPLRSEGRRTDAVPGRGEAWPDARLAARLGVAVGDSIAVGDTTLAVTAIVQNEPEVASGLFSLAPRLLIDRDDVPATNLLQPGNRATYRLLVADRSSRNALDAYLDWAGRALEPGQRMENVRDLRPEVRQTLERAEQFLGLSALVAVILAAVAIALAASRYLRRHLDTAAMLRCFGAKRRDTLVLFALQFGALGVAASAGGIAVAFAGQQLLVALLASIAAAGDLPAPGALPAVVAFATGILLLFGFALPPLVALAGVPPLRVLRRDLPRPRPGGIVAYGGGAAVIAALVAWQAQDAKAGSIMVGAIGGLLVVAAIAAWGLIALLKRLPQRGVSWRFGLANLHRRPLASSLQVGALALGLMALLLLTVVRGDLMRNWRASVPADAPNQFVINVLPDQVDGVRASLARASGGDVALYPMIRGRLVEVNGVRLDTARYEDTRARRLAEREFNLSWASELPSTNRLVGGRWFDGATGAAAGISMEQGIADTLKLKVGDALTWDIAGTPVTAKITSLRKVDWDSFRPNFFTLFAPGVLEAMPRTYIGAARVPEDAQAAWLASLVQRYPNVLAIDVGEILRQIQSIIDQVAAAVEFVFLFTLAGGLLVLQAAIAATQDERRLDAAILRTLGASRAQLSAAQVAEFVVLGSLAGLLAALGATVTGYVLSDRVFQIPYTVNPLVILVGVGGGAAAVALAGWLGTRGLMRQPPLAVIRQLG